MPNMFLYAGRMYKSCARALYTYTGKENILTSDRLTQNKKFHTERRDKKKTKVHKDRTDRAML